MKNVPTRRAKIAFLARHDRELCEDRVRYEKMPTIELGKAIIRRLVIMQNLELQLRM